MNKTGVVVAVFVALLIGLIAYSTMAGAQYRVRLCMTFHGQTSCKTVSAKSEKGALEAAVTGACADVASGVTETMNCTQSAPSQTTWLTRPH